MPKRYLDKARMGLVIRHGGMKPKPPVDEEPLEYEEIETEGHPRRRVIRRRACPTCFDVIATEPRIYASQTCWRLRATHAGLSRGLAAPAGRPAASETA